VDPALLVEVKVAFAGSKLVVVEPALLAGVKLYSPVAVDLAALGASW